MKGFKFYVAFFLSSFFLHANPPNDNFFYSSFFNLTEQELDEYVKDFFENIYEPSFSQNGGGMHSPDMFSLYLTLKMVQPTVVIESGVWKGESTKVIRKTLGKDCKIICLDPSRMKRYTDRNPNTINKTGSKFIDFSNLNLDAYHGEKILVFFDDHINAPRRLLEAYSKGITHVFFNDNWPLDGGSHVSIEHVIKLDERSRNTQILSFLDNELNSSHPSLLKGVEELKKEILPIIKQYHLFPNFFDSNIFLVEGIFKTDGFFPLTDDNINKYKLFFDEKQTYCWNTYIELY